MQPLDNVGSGMIKKQSHSQDLVISVHSEDRDGVLAVLKITFQNQSLRHHPRPPMVRNHGRDDHYCQRRDDVGFQLGRKSLGTRGV